MPTTKLMNYRRSLLSLIALLAMASVMACGGEEEVEVVTTGDVEWGYSGAGAPENWASISADNALCGEGAKQSPVDITGHQPGDAPPISFSYRRDAVEIANDGKVLSINYGRGNRLGLSERTYQLATVNLHTPSEHTIDGQSFALELQIVNEQTFGDIAVVSFLHSVGDPDPVIQGIIDAAPASGQSATEGLVLNAGDFAPEDLGYYKYEGSLTKPPCTEPVDWFIMLEQRTVSQEQVDQISALTGGTNNNRPMQPLGGRGIAASGSRR